MKALLVCALLATTATVSFAQHHEVCKKNDMQLKSELEGVKELISKAAKESFDKVQKDLGCQDWSCTVRNLCETDDLEAAKENYFREKQIREIHNAATACDSDADNKTPTKS